ncbi:MAG: chitobiase/beta-hexosaminidase C-terminal domain-containing protein [Planctomycetota bacterium]|jgi:hypothetical protein
MRQTRRTLETAAVLAALGAALLLAAAARAEDAPAAKAEAKQPTTLPAGAKPWSEKDFVHPPLKCMEKYVNITEYPVMAWCFHGRGCPGYNIEYVKQADMAGFNTLIDVQLMLKPAEKFENMMVMVPAFKFPPKGLVAMLFRPYPNHPRLIGVILDDNCPGIYPIVRHSAKWVAENHPHVVPYISENPRPDVQSKTPMRILGTQNYEMYRGRGVIGYCERLNYDRYFGNKNDMSFWPIFAAPIGHTAYRFQVYAALAYGAQGVVCFAYAPGDRWPHWKAPDGTLAKMARPVHMYARKVAGRHLWGTRCLGVYHSAKDHIPRGDGKAAKDKVVQYMDPNMLVGFLVPEKEFYDWKDEKAPTYAMVVDKRAHKRWSDDKPRTARVSFHPIVTTVEVLGKLTGTEQDKIRIIEPGWSVPLHLLTGDGVLLKLNPKGVSEIFGPKSTRYLSAIRAVGHLREKLSEGSVALGAFDECFAGVDANISALKKLLADAEAPEDSKLNLAQRAETLKRLTERIEEVRAEALQPRIVGPDKIFTGSAEVTLVSRVKGSDIRYTLDGTEPTLESPRYTGSIRLTESAELRARGAGGRPPALVGQEVSATLKKVKDALAAIHRINFQPKDAPVPDGALADYGELFDARESGFAYGWNRNMTPQAAKRDKHEDPLRDTLVPLARGAVWEHLLENGTYEVTVVIGDPVKAIRGGTVYVEGVEFFRNVKLNAGEFKELTKQVAVSDGRLTVSSNGPRKRAFWTPINSVVIRRKD